MSVAEARELLERSKQEMTAARILIELLGSENERLHDRCVRYREALVAIVADEGEGVGDSERNRIAMRALRG